MKTLLLFIIITSASICHVRRCLWYLFDLGAGKFLSEKEKKYLHELFEKWDPEHVENNEDFNDGPKDNIGDEGMQILEDY